MSAEQVFSDIHELGGGAESGVDINNLLSGGDDSSQWGILKHPFVALLIGIILVIVVVVIIWLVVKLSSCDSFISDNPRVVIKPQPHQFQVRESDNTLDEMVETPSCQKPPMPRMFDISSMPIDNYIGLMGMGFKGCRENEGIPNSSMMPVYAEDPRANFSMSAKEANMLYS